MAAMRILRKVPAPLLAGAVMAVIGSLAWAVSVPWLFPSLGPTIAIQSQAPDSAVAKPWNVIVGNVIGAAVGLACVHLTGAIGESPVNVAHLLSASRLVAAILAMALSMALQHAARADHPPAQATTLLIVVGALDADLQGAGVLLAGILLVAVLGEAVRRSKATPSPSSVAR
jgi:CBS-domain-containing membrane protein